MGDYIYDILLLIAAAVVVVDVEEAVAVKAMGNSAMVMGGGTDGKQEWCL